MFVGLGDLRRHALGRARPGRPRAADARPRPVPVRARARVHHRRAVRARGHAALPGGGGWCSRPAYWSMLQEYGRGGEPEHAVLFMSLVMLVQQGCTFWARRRTVLAFTTIVFGADCRLRRRWTCSTPTCNLTGVTMGVSLLCVGWSLDRVRRTGRWPGWCTSSAPRCCSTDLRVAAARAARNAVPRPGLRRGRAGDRRPQPEPAGRGHGRPSSATSRDFIYRHFADNLGAPLVLMAIGLVFIGRRRRRGPDQRAVHRGEPGAACQRCTDPARRSLASLDKMKGPL